MDEAEVVAAGNCGGALRAASNASNTVAPRNPWIQAVLAPLSPIWYWRGISLRSGMIALALWLAMLVFTSLEPQKLYVCLLSKVLDRRDAKRFRFACAIIAE